MFVAVINSLGFHNRKEIIRQRGIPLNFVISSRNTNIYSGNSSKKKKNETRWRETTLVIAVILYTVRSMNVIFKKLSTDIRFRVRG